MRKCREILHLHLRPSHSSHVSRSFSSGATTNNTKAIEEIVKGFEVSDTDWTSRPFFYKVLKQVSGDPHTALSFFTWVTKEKQFVPTTSEYNALLEILGPLHMFSEMKNVMKMMDMKKCKMLPSTFTILIKYYAKSGLVDDAIRCLEQMKRCGVKPNVQTYNNLIDAFVKEGKINLVLGMIDQMKCDGIQPNEYTLNFLVEGLCSSGQLDKAIEIVRESSANGVVYNVLLKGLCKAGKIEEAYQIVEEMISRGHNPDEYTYNTLVVGACKVGKLDFALGLRMEMIRRKVSPSIITYGTLIMFLCRYKRGEEAYHLLGEMKSDGIVLTEQDQSSLKAAFLRSNRRTSAAAIIRDMGSSSTRTHGMELMAMERSINKCLLH